MAVVAAIAGLLVLGGAMVLVSGWSRSWPEHSTVVRNDNSLAAIWSKVSKRPAGQAGRRRDITLLVSIVIGFLVASLTGWLVALPLVPVLVFGLPYLLVMPKPRDVELLEALDRWIRSLVSTLTTGKSVTDAIRVSRRTAPEPLADEVNLLVARLNNRWDTRDALMRFADALDSPDADSVVAALILAANRGSNGASITLSALADSLQSQLKGRRLIETERSKPYVVVRQVTIITVVTLAAAFVLGGSFFSFYGTPLGQVVLSALIALYLGSLVLLRRQAQQRPRSRILVGHHR